MLKRFFFLVVILKTSGSFGFQVEPPGLKFIENKNQWSPDVHYAARIPGGNMMVSPGKFAYYFIDKKKLQDLHEDAHQFWSEATAQPETETLIDAHAVEVNLLNSNNNAKPIPFGKSSEYYNFFLGKDSCQWASQAYAYEGILYQAVYAGIDLKIYSQGRNMKYDLVVSPLADPDQIELQYSGAEELSLDNGNIMLKTSLGYLIEKRPFAYQFIEGKKSEVSCEYDVRSDRMSFHFPDGYDPCYELVIDPLLIFSTFSGSDADNWGSTATPGERGCLYSSGVTNHFVSTQTGNVFSGEFPATPGAFQITYGQAFDVSILKYDSTGKNLLYASYLGGIQSESPHSLLMNGAQELLVLGTTASDNFPVTADAVGKTFKGGSTVTPIGFPYVGGSDIFISRISKDGTTLLASTYLGGAGNDGINPNGILVRNYGDQLRGDIISDAVGNIYISSVTSSADFPVTKGADTLYNGGSTDAVLMKLDADLSKVIWGTYLGGSQVDASHTLKFDAGQNIFIAGGTSSADFPNTPGSFQQDLAGDADGWIARISANGKTILNATFTGTASFDQVYFLDLNSTGEVYVYGQSSGDMAITPGVYGNEHSGQFLQKFSADLSSQEFSTTFGSGRILPDISPTAFMVSDCNTIYMSGWGGLINSGHGGWNTNTVGMRITPDAHQPNTSGSDFYFIVLAEDARSLLYATYLGGNVSRTHVDGGTSRFDKEGVIYHSVCSGCKNSITSPPTSDFPTTPGAWSRTNESLNCNNAAFKFDLASLKARLEVVGGITNVCLPYKLEFRNLSSGGETYHWNFGDGTPTATTSNTVTFFHEYETPGVYTVSLVARDPATCTVSDTISVQISTFIAQSEVQDDDNVCGGSSYQLKADGGLTYHWTTKDLSFESFEEDPIDRPQDTTMYYVDITEASGCTKKDSVLLNFVPKTDADFEVIRESACTARPFITVRSLADSLKTEDDIFFDLGDGTVTEEKDLEHFYEKDSLYMVKHVIERGGCIFEKAVTIPAFTMTIPNVITPGSAEGSNDRLLIQFGRDEEKNDAPVRTPGDYGINVALTIYNRWGELVYETKDYQYDWSAEAVSSGVYFYEVRVDGYEPCKSWIQVMK